MSGNKNNYEQRLKLLTDRFSLLRVRLEATAYQIKLMGGALPFADEHYLNMLEEHIQAIDNEMQRENEWENKVITAMRSIGQPCAAKEISEIIFANQDAYSLSGIHIQVKSALHLLAKNNVVGVLPSRNRKYFLEENLEDMVTKWYKDIAKKS